MAPQVLWHIPQNRLETMDDILVHSRCCRRSMRRSRTRIIPTGPLSRSLCLCWPSSSLIPRPSPLSRRSLLLRWRLEYLYLPPARCHICTYTKQTTNKDISIYTSKAGPLVYQQHKYKSQKPKTSHTSMIEYLPRRQHHVRVPPEIHSRIWEPEDKLRRLPPDLCGLL
jgi:hypothetical protein